MPLNHDLQTAFRTASLEALVDLGGPQSFPRAWITPRDVPAQLIFPIERYHAQAALLSNCLVQLQRAKPRGSCAPSQWSGQAGDFALGILCDCTACGGGKDITPQPASFWR